MKHLALLLLLAAPSWAIDVSSCGTSLATQGATYVLTTDLVQTGATACLTFTATNPANIELDLNGHTITFDGSAIAINGRDNIEIHSSVPGGALIGASTGYSGTAFTWFGINGSNSASDNITVHDITISFDHDAAPEPYGFYLSNVASDNVEIYNVTCTMAGAFRSTCFEVTGAGAKTNWYIHDNTITMTGTMGGRPTGVGLIGSTGAEISYNTITVNDSGTVGDIDEAQLISCFNCATANIHHNTINDYGTHGRAFTADNMAGGSIHHNQINMLGDGSAGVSQGIGMRGTTDGVEVYQNVIDARGCNGTGSGCRLLWIGSDVNPSDNTYPSGNRIHDNWLYVDGVGANEAMLWLEDWELDNRFWNNTISCEDAAHCLQVDPLNGVQTDGELAFSLFIDASSRTAVDFYNSANIADIDLCENEVNGSPLASGDITNNGSTLPGGEPGITASSCLCETEALGCGPTVGARAEGNSVTVTGSATFTGSFTF